MKCPSCEHNLTDNLLHCDRCGVTVDEEALRAYEKLTFTREWLEFYGRLLSPAQRHVIVGRLDEELAQAWQEVSRFFPQEEPEAPAAPEPEVLPVALSDEPAPAESVAIESTVTAEPTPPAPAQPERAPEPVFTEQVTAKRTALRETRPARPRVSVGERLRQAAVSGALLRGLLYLGALMIVVSAAIMVIRFWDLFAPWLQVSFVAAVPTLFYVAGWVCRRWLKLTIAGTALTSIGAPLVPVACAGAYQLDLLGSIPIDAFWLASAVGCTVLYAVTMWRLPSEFTGTITILGLGNVFVAFCFWLDLPVVWSLAAIGLAALMAVVMATYWRGGKRWHGPVVAGYHVSLIALPLSQVVALTFLRRPWAAGATFALATVGYTIMCWRGPRRLFGLHGPRGALPYAAILSSAGTLALVLISIEIDAAWTSIAFAAGGILYLALAAFAMPRAPTPLAVQGRLVNGAKIMAFSLGGLATLTALPVLLFGEIWHAVGGLFLAAGILFLAAVWLKQPRALFLGACFLTLPLLITAVELLSVVSRLQDWLGIILVAQALIYLIAAHRLPAPDIYAKALHASAQLLPLLALGILVGDLRNLAWSTRIALPTAALAGALFLFYLTTTQLEYRQNDPALSHVLRDRSGVQIGNLPVWLAAMLLPTLLGLAGAAVGLPNPAVAIILLALCGFYVVAAGRAPRLRQAYFPPLAFVAVALWLTGLALTEPLITRWAWSTTGILAALAQLLGAGLLVLAAQQQRARWPLLIEPFVALLTAWTFTAMVAPQQLTQWPNLIDLGYLHLGVAIAHLVGSWLMERRWSRQARFGTVPYPHYAHALYLSSYVILTWAVGLATGSRISFLIIMGSALVVAALSQWLVHIGQHASFEALLAALNLGDQVPRRPRWAQGQSHTFFLWIATLSFPFWALTLLSELALPRPWQGLALSLLAVFALILGLRLRRVDARYGLPCLVPGYALTVAAIALAAPDRLPLLLALAVNTGLYAATAFLFQVPLWLWLACCQIPAVAWLILDQLNLLNNAWLAGTFAALSFALLAGGLWLRREYRKAFAIVPAVFAVLYNLAALAIAIGSWAFFDDSAWLVMGIFGAGALFYGLLAVLYQIPLFVYPAAWLAVVPYFVGLTLIKIPDAWRGLALLPITVLYIVIGRFIFRLRSLSMGLPNLLQHPALPFYLMAYFVTLPALLASGASALALMLAALAVALIYFGSAFLFRHFAWLYPAILAVHLTLLASMGVFFPGPPSAMMAVPFHGLTWVLALAMVILVWRRPLGKLASRYVEALPTGVQRLLDEQPALRPLLTGNWAQPLWVFVVIDVALWQLVAATDVQVSLWLAAGHALLLGLLGTIWRDSWLPYLSLAFGTGTLVLSLVVGDVPRNQMMAWLSGAGMALYLFSLVLRQPNRRFTESGAAAAPVRLWSTAGWRWSWLLTLGPALLAWTSVLDAPHLTAIPVTVSGLFLLSIAYERRQLRLSYAGVALLEIAWLLWLAGNEIGQPQLVALPVGLYLAGIGVLERRRRFSRLACGLETVGLAVPLLTSFVQSLDLQTGGIYFLILLLEGIAVIWWGALRRVRLPFFLGLAASVLNIVAQVVQLALVNELVRWIAIFTVGVLIVLAAVMLELQRARWAERVQTWRQTLTGWEL